MASIRPHADEAVKIICLLFLSDAKHHFVWKPVCRPCASLAQIVLTMSAVEWFEHAGNEMPLCGYRPDLCLAQLMLTTSAVWGFPFKSSRMAFCQDSDHSVTWRRINTTRDNALWLCRMGSSKFKSSLALHEASRRNHSVDDSLASSLPNNNVLPIESTVQRSLACRLQDIQAFKQTTWLWAIRCKRNEKHLTQAMLRFKTI